MYTDIHAEKRLEENIPKSYRSDLWMVKLWVNFYLCLNFQE